MARSEPAEKVRLTKTDERLLIEAAQRDRARFADIYEEYFELVYAYVARRVHDRSAAEDLTSDVFHKALASLPKFKWTGAPFASWLFRIASNLIADRAKRRAKISATSEEIELLPQDSRKNSQAGLEEVERQAQLFRLVEKLTEDQQRVVALRFAEERSIKQIAVELGRTEGAVKQLQFRALENLRKQLLPQRTQRKN
jgi:RNA polymerase sigma-70 factor (ECF subfamily)